MEDQSSMSNSGLDRSVLDQLYQLGQGSGKLICSVIDAFRRTMPGYMNDLRDGVVARDVDAIRMASHAMKSSAANLGAVDFAARCQIVEHQAREGKLENSVEDLAILEAMMPVLMESLDREYAVATLKNAA